MTKKTPSKSKAEPLLDRGQISRFISAIENRSSREIRDLKKFFSSESLRRTICFTGPAGVGKSTLISRLLPLAGVQKQKIAWLACDPSSPRSGGAILGDRIRLSDSQSRAEDLDSAYIRSLSTRGTQAFSQSIRDIEVFLEHYFDRIWIETAGSGQTQSEVARISALTVLILQPETGDEIQWMKSGVREWADVFLIHKSDLGGAEQMEKNLIEMGAAPESVLCLSSQTGQNLSQALALIERHLDNLDWKSRSKILHTELAQSLFFERALPKLRAAFQKKKTKLLKQPY